MNQESLENWLILQLRPGSQKVSLEHLVVLDDTVRAHSKNDGAIQKGHRMKELFSSQTGDNVSFKLNNDGNGYNPLTHIGIHTLMWR